MPALDSASELYATLFPLLNRVDRFVLLWVILGAFSGWMILEFAFWAGVEMYLAPQLQHAPKRHPVETDPSVFLSRIMDSVDNLECYSIEKYIEGFFLKNSIEEIYEENLFSFIAWAVFHKRREELNPLESREARKALEDLQARYPSLKNLTPGYNPSAKHCTFTLDPVPYMHRPLLLYVLKGLNEIFFNVVFFWLQGYRRLEVDKVTYWIKQGSSRCALPPVLFFHGISPGWSIYTMLIKYFETVDRTIIMVDLEAVKVKSMRFYMPPIEHFTQHVLLILRRHNIDKVSVVGHSFGSIVAGWLVTRHPDIVTHVTLLDPVSLLLCLPDVAYSFVYRPPDSFVEWFLYLLAAREITVSYMLHRNFCWHKNMLWLEDIPAHIGVVVGIGSRDEIANATAVEEYVLCCHRKRVEADAAIQVVPEAERRKRADIHFLGWKEFSHGQILVTPDRLADVHRVVVANEKVCRDF